MLVVLLVFSAVMSACKKEVPTAEPTVEAVSEVTEDDSKMASEPPQHIVKTLQAEGF